MASSAAPPLLEIRQISKRFGDLQANRAISLTLQSGEIHAVIGENGAGKSTLMQILYGRITPDSGEILLEGKPLASHDTAAARAAGITMVFQQFALFEALTGLENLRLSLGKDMTSRALRDKALIFAQRYGFWVKLDTQVSELSAGEHQRLEVLRCIMQEPKVLILDEPTSVLTPQEAEGLFETIRLLARGGTGIIYISHKLREIRALCDRATVLRRGKVVATPDPQKTELDAMARAMLGDDLLALADLKATGATQASTEKTQAKAQAQAKTTEEATEKTLSAKPAKDSEADTATEIKPPSESPSEPRLAVRGLSLASGSRHAVALDDISFSVAAGEIFGIAGIAGNGQNALLEALSGERLLPQGQEDAIHLKGQAIGQMGVTARRRLGLAAVPEDRHGHGAVGDLSLKENILLTGIHVTQGDRALVRKSVLGGGWLRLGRACRVAEEVIERFAIQGTETQGADTLARKLSGGNLQRFIVGRGLLRNPDLLIVLQPTWGVDAHAAARIHQALRDAARGGAGVLLISQDLDELLALSHRLAVLARGKLSQAFACADFYGVANRGALRQELGLLMTGLDAGDSHPDKRQANTPPHDSIEPSTAHATEHSRQQAL